MSESAKELDLAEIFARSDVSEREMTPRRFMDVLMDFMGFTIERAQEMLSKLIELKRVVYSDRYTVVLDA